MPKRKIPWVLKLLRRTRLLAAIVDRLVFVFNATSGMRLARKTRTVVTRTPSPVSIQGSGIAVWVGLLVLAVAARVVEDRELRLGQR